MGTAQNLLDLALKFCWADMDGVVLDTGDDWVGSSPGFGDVQPCMEFLVGPGLTEDGDEDGR